MTFGSLFAGIGGIDLGLERAGMECAWQVENDPYAIKVLEKHWPKVHREKDVKECGAHNLETVDLIAGGFPCQPHSVAGKRRGAADDRNFWPEFSRIIAELRPRYILAENVPGIITTYLDEVLADLDGQGYICGTFDIPACAFDAPHRRQRIFVVGWNSNGWNGHEGKIKEMAKRQDTESAGVCKSLSDTEQKHDDSGGYGAGEVCGERSQTTRLRGCKQNVSDTPITNDRRSSPEQMRGQTQQSGVGTVEGDVADTGGNRMALNGESGESQRKCGNGRGVPQDDGGEFWTVEPTMGELVNGVSGRLVRFRGRIASGIPNRVAKLKCLGNAVVPAVAQYVGERILELDHEIRARDMMAIADVVDSGGTIGG